MVTIDINDTKYQLPQSWNEANKKQRIGLYSIIMSDSESEELLPDEIIPAKRARMIQFLLGLNDKFMAAWHLQRKQEHGEDGDAIFYSELQELCNQLDGFFEITTDDEDNKSYSLRLSFTQCPFPTLVRKAKKKKRITYYGPADGLSNLSLYELGMSFTQFESYLESQDIQQAYRLAAMLYRPGKAASKKNLQSGYQGDRRLPLLNHEATIEQRIKHIAKLPPIVLQLILFWFASCRAQIVENNADIFTSSGDDPKKPNFGWGGVLLSMADGLVHLDQVGSQPYQNGLMYLRYLEAQRKEMEQKMKKKT